MKWYFLVTVFALGLGSASTPTTVLALDEHAAKIELSRKHFSQDWYTLTTYSVTCTDGSYANITGRARRNVWCIGGDYMGQCYKNRNDAAMMACIDAAEQDQRLVQNDPVVGSE